MAGSDWLEAFMKFENLSLRTPEATSIARVAGFTRAKVLKFFDILKKIKDQYKIPADRIFNMDETGTSNVQTPKKILAETGTKQVGRITPLKEGRT